MSSFDVPIQAPASSVTVPTTTTTVDAISVWAASAALLGLGLLPGLPRVSVYSIQRMRAAHPEWFKADLGTLLQMTAERIHRPHVSRTFALSEARLADEALARGERGKFVLLA